LPGWLEWAGREFLPPQATVTTRTPLPRGHTNPVSRPPLRMLELRYTK
jgi:hypothetical protein